MVNISDFFSATTLSLLDNRRKTIIPQVSANVEEEYKKYTNEVSDKKYQYSMLGITGLGMGQIIADGQIPASDAPIQGFAKTFVQVIFTSRVRLSQQGAYYMLQNGDQVGLDKMIADQITDVKNAVVHLKNYLAQSYLMGGFGTSVTFVPQGSTGASATTLDTTGADGVAFFSASHPREDGGTAWSNLITSGTVNPTLSLTAIIAARAQHTAKKDGRGLPLIGSTLDRIIVLKNSAAYALASSIKATLDSGKYPSAQPGVAGSFVDANPTYSFELIGLANYGGTGVTSAAWFMFDSKKLDKHYGLQYVKSMELQSTPFQVDYVGNMDIVSTATEYATFGGADFRYFMASNGLAS